MARRLGATELQVGAARSGDGSAFEPAWGSALAYASAMTPVGASIPEDVQSTLARHWTPEQIVEITAVVALFNYFNRFALALRIPVTR
ncbi:MAG: carboxymuconolactone decarboxylase family protein [Gemmatimonadaceae bacterium]